MCVNGSASAFLVYFSRGAPTEIRPAVKFAVRKWDDRFESRVAIRVCVEWTQMNSYNGSGPESSTLGATSVPFVRHSAEQMHANLVAGAAYDPALAASLTGSDPLKGGQEHVRIMLSWNIRWDLNTSARAGQDVRHGDERAARADAWSVHFWHAAETSNV